MARSRKPVKWNASRRVTHLAPRGTKLGDKGATTLCGRPLKWYPFFNRVPKAGTVDREWTCTLCIRKRAEGGRQAA